MKLKEKMVFKFLLLLISIMPFTAVADTADFCVYYNQEDKIFTVDERIAMNEDYYSFTSVNSTEELGFFIGIKEIKETAKFFNKTSSVVPPQSLISEQIKDFRFCVKKQTISNAFCSEKKIWTFYHVGFDNEITETYSYTYCQP